MSVRQLKAPCWVADAIGGEDGAHFDDEDQARDVIGFPARELPEPCWVADCDVDDDQAHGSCEARFGDEDEGFDYLHGRTPGELRLWLARDGWTAGEDGTVRCTNGEGPP